MTFWVFQDNTIEKNCFTRSFSNKHIATYFSKTGHIGIGVFADYRRLNAN